MKFYSDNGIDEFVRPILPDIGFCCDVGANDGLFASNSLYFEENGWTVLCVEPNPLLAEEGRARRKLWREVAAGAKDERLEFCAAGPPPYASNSGIGCKEPGQKFEVQVLRLDRILEEAGFSRLDFLTVDVEDYERQVMEGFTVERWKPKIIVLESWLDNQPVPDGYERIARHSYDNVYLRSS